ncbi:hypothetical protein A4A49_52224 [Nicotiana attenuata]|uniref:B3 domain-containing protein n=1 Tax=Nicotiana attenuata TaxID=49451 RepID=A0A314KLR3_NICAT|nr:hypothetical protein A4A49_52224 [Nicotiana attenuata]
MEKKPEKKEKMVKNTKEDIAAALIMAGFKRTEKRREEEAKKRRNLGTKPEFGYSIDGTKLPRFPPIQNLKQIIGKCSYPFEKKMTKTDLDYDGDKFSLNIYDVKRAILPLLNEHEIGNIGTGISVKTFDQSGNCYEMIFQTYRNSIYKLYNGWKKLLKYHKLKKNGDYYAAVWMFRHKENDGLCFALM